VVIAECVNCKQVRCRRARGLCGPCYLNTDVRALFPSTSKFAKRGSGTGGGSAPLADEPTFELPGTPQKVEVMRERASLRQRLFHPGDA
jgi:hypothetical protein